MKKAGHRLLVVGIIGGLFLLGWRMFFPSDRVRIGKLLDRLEQASNLAASESQLVKLVRIQRIEEMFVPQCQVAVDTFEYGKLRLSGRDELVQTVSAASVLGQAVTVKILQTGIQVAESKTNALVEVAAAVRTSQGRRETLLLRLRLDKTEGAWRLTKVESIPTLHM